MSQLVQHKSRYYQSTIHFPSVESYISNYFTADHDGEVYEVSTSNVVSWTIGGSSSLPISVTKSIKYTVAITKTTNGQEAQIIIKMRRGVNKSVSKIISPLLSESVQGTKLLSIRGASLDVVDCSLINDSNYLGAGSWTSNPLSTITMPVIANFAWSYAGYDYLQDRQLFVSTPTAGTQTAVHMCAYHYSGIYAGQIRTLDGATQNGYTTLTIDSPQTRINSAPYFIVIDYSTQKIFITGSGNSARVYSNSLSTLTGTWTHVSAYSLITLYNNFNLLCHNFYNHSVGKHLARGSGLSGTSGSGIVYQDINTLSQEQAGFIGLSSGGIMCENIYGDVYISNDSPSTIYVYNDGVQVASFGGGGNIYYKGIAMCSASIKQRAIIAGMQDGFGNKYVHLINLSTRTKIKSDDFLTANDANATGFQSAGAQYLNSIDKFVLVSKGTGVSNYRLWFIKSDDDTTLFKYYLDLPALGLLFTNRIQY